MNRSQAVRHTLWGETKSLAEWREDRRAAQVSQGTLRSRLKNGWGLEKALTTPVRTYSETAHVELFGERKALLAWSKDPRCVVPYGTLHDRFAKNGWDLEQALITPSREQPKGTAGPVVGE